MDHRPEQPGGGWRFVAARKLLLDHANGCIELPVSDQQVTARLHVPR